MRFQYGRRPYSSAQGRDSHCIKKPPWGVKRQWVVLDSRLGYEIPLTEKLGLAPIVDYNAGSLGDVRNSLAVETGRRYSVVDSKWH